MESSTTRLIYYDILTYLKAIGRSESVWDRADFESHFSYFKDCREDITISCSNFLYKASRSKPRLLRVRRGVVVEFLYDIEKLNSDPNESTKSGTNRRRRHAKKRPHRRQHQGVQIENSRSQNNLTLKSPADNALVENKRQSKSYKDRSNTTVTRDANESKSRATASSIFPEDEVSLDKRLKAGKVLTLRNINTSYSANSGRRTHHHTEETKYCLPLIQSDTTGISRSINDDNRYHISASSRIIGQSFSSRKGESPDQREVDSEFLNRTTIAGVRPEFMEGGLRREAWGLANYVVPHDTELKYLSGELWYDPFFRLRLSAKNYVEKFHLLLYIEELQYRTEIQSYTMRSAVMQKKPRSGKDLLYLDVPGLAENRPSLLIGDRVYAVKLDSKGNEYGERYEGFVHVVEKQQVGLGFNTKLSGICQKRMKFAVRFTFNRRPLRLMHRALDGINSSRLLAEMLFPTRQPKPYVPPKGKLFMKKRDIESNDEQRIAVENIVLGKIPPVYIIFGPPGTGKTVTMVEAIYQTQKHFNYNILVCALCNNACDMLASKLQDYVDKSKMIRVYAASRSWSSVPDKVKQGNTNFRDRELYMPDEKEISSYRIVICTFVTAGRIASMKLQGHFKRIFIDESGQAFEPECLVAVSGILSNDGRLILAGDPKQLGPIVRSPLAIRHGLQMSLLQRLMDTCPVYQKDVISGKYNPQCVTKLVRNYRSHDVILRTSNEHFYDGELQVCADELKRNKMCGWEWLKNKKFPIIFHGIEGKQTQDQSSPSYYNPDEVKIVKDYVEKLMQSRGTHKLMSPSYIGIVTPYRKQCEKIRQAIKKYPEIDVGSVEVFQGQERPVIIISTVRSSKEGLTDDAKYHLGFLCDPKRFNVALTRAQALLVIVGNPRMLSLDKYWKALLKYCLENDAYCGAKFSSEDFKGASDMDEIENLFKKMEIEPSEECENEDDLAAPFWRREH